MHISNIYEEELAPETTIKKLLTVRTEGKREVKRLLDYYSFDMIISVGYRVKSRVATRFRIWATQQLSEFNKTVQNKMHRAITGQTAAEIIHSRANAEKPNMDLTTYAEAWPDQTIVQQAVGQYRA